MTNEQAEVAKWMVAFGQEVKASPEIPSEEVRRLRAELILEEAIELINALGFIVNHSTKYNRPVVDKNVDVGANINHIADGCADLQVVTMGTQAACGLLFPQHKDSDPIFDEVMRSNWTKAWTSEEVVDANADPNCNIAFNMFSEIGYDGRLYIARNSSGKVVKSPSYSPVNLVNLL